jgi:hypothetical protein
LAGIAQSVYRLATGWMVRGSNSGWMEIFCTRPDRLRVHPAFCFNVYRVSSPGVRRPRHGVDSPPPSSAAVKERVELYLCAPLCFHGLFWGELYQFTCSKAQYHIPQDVRFHPPPLWEHKVSHFRKCLNANRLIKRALGSTMPLLKNIELK